MTEAYTPTPDERSVTLARGDFLKLSGDGVFATLQGEGVNAGAPSVFVRLQNCNLACGVNGGWRCDAWYTWDRTTEEYWKETQNLRVEEVAELVEEAWVSTFGQDELDMPPALVVSGGEPLLQQRKVASLFAALQGWRFEIETNGTVMPIDDMQTAQINCSPKLESSGNPLGVRYKPRVLEHISEFSNSWFKFVVTGSEDEAEIVKIIDEIGIDPERVLLMSEGTTHDELTYRDRIILPMAARIGCLTTDRNHIFWYGDKRAT